MKCIIGSVALATAFILTGSACNAQDGWVFSAKPPIVVRQDLETVTYHFTNTSEKPLHGVTINSVKNGESQSVVIIDTIEPHKTVAVDWSRVIASAPGGLHDATITCTDYSSPIKLIP